MTFLLDTHTLLWAIDQPSRLSRKVVSILTREDNELIVSAASLWEILLKAEAGKLRMPATAEFFDAHMTKLGVERILSISPAHVYAILGLPAVHKDPFDRLLAAQCKVEGLPLISNDAVLRRYPIKIVW
jgi:PIN domain nuclease of toxin-antitoxin system